MPPTSSLEERRAAARHVTLQDIADRCGVSNVTVSRALRGDAKNVGAKTISRILAVAEEMGYDATQQQAARRLAYRKHGIHMPTRAIALFLPRNFATMSYFVQIFAGVVDVMEAQEFSLVTGYLASHDGGLAPLLRRGEVDGAIVIGLEPLSPLYQQLRQTPALQACPLVSVLQPLPGCSAVLSDDYLGGYAAASHLMDLGHRHLLHSCFASYQHQQRLAGYRQAFLDHGLLPEDGLHFTEMHWIDTEHTVLDDGFLQVLRAHPEITGILAPNDRRAQRIYELLRQADLPAPEAISLVGYDDADPIPGPDGRNLLTSVQVPLTEIGREAARLAILRVTGEVQAEHQVVLPTQLVIRGTTAPPGR